MSTTVTRAETGTYLVHVDPRELLAHPGNLRRDLGDYTALRATIARDGLLQAVTAVPDRDGYRLIAGHRRTAAAAAGLDAGEWPADRAATIPVMVRPDLVSLDAHVLAMLNENDTEQRAPLTATERAAGYAQLAAFDWSAEEMAARTGKKPDQVRASLRLAGMSDAVREAADADTLTLDDIAALAEFDDDPKALARILKHAGSPWGVRHRIADERRKRVEKARAAELTAELTAAGVKIIKQPKGWPYDCQPAALAALVDAEGDTPDPETVRALDGYAAILYPGAGDEVRYVCLDPEGMGYTRTRHSYYKSQAAREAEAAEEQARHARAAALADARTLREQCVIATYGTAKAAKTLLVEALRVAVSPDAGHHLGRGAPTLVKALTGMEIDLSRAGIDRLHRVLVALYVAGEEANVNDCATYPGRWRNNPRAAVAWLDRLTRDGYELSQAETELRADLIAWIEADEADTADDDEDEDLDDDDLGDEEEAELGADAPAEA